MPFAPSPTDGSIPTDLVLLAAERAVTVTREEHHQDVLSGRTGQAVVELRPCTIASGKHAGQDGLEVVLDGRRVGELTRLMAQRYRPMVDDLTARGYRAGCEAFLQEDARGTQVELRLPAGPTTAGLPSARHPAAAPTVRSRRPAPFAPGPTTVAPHVPRQRPPAPTTAVPHATPQPPSPIPPAPGRGDLAACSGWRARRSGYCCSHPPSATPPGTTSRPPSRHCRPCAAAAASSPALPWNAGDEPDAGRRVRRGAGGRGCPTVDHTGSAPGGDVEARDPGTGGDVQARAPDRPGRTEAGAGQRNRPVATRTTADACRSRATWTVRAAAATARRT